MKNISLTQFQSISGLSDAALCVLLRKNQLPCTYDKEHGILIEVSSVEVASLVRAIAERVANPAPAVQEIINERVGGIIADAFERVRDEAIERLHKK
jgi:hypothetical protein